MIIGTMVALLVWVIILVAIAAVGFKVVRNLIKWMLK